MSGGELSRRAAMGAGLVGAAGVLGVGGVAVAAGAGERPGPQGRTSVAQRVLRVAHLTDLHIQPERRASEGVVACLHHVQSLPDKPDLILTGGDLIMDGFAASRSRTQVQWDLFTKVLRDECSIPVEHCLGNHDIWGWDRKRSETSGDEPGWGKQWAVDLLGLPGAYRSFDRAGWHFVVLDSVFPDGPDGEKYIGRLDEQQHEWLAADLAAAGDTPTLVLSHIPILTVTNLVTGQGKDGRDWRVPAGLMMTDWLRLRTLFAKHPNVRLALSGHTHHVDRVDYNGVTYLCNGAVSGNWWRGKHHDCEEGYGVIDLYEDGSFGHEYVRYGWRAGG